MRDLNKFKGCLIGGAVGDALGYAVEFMSADAIFKKYGESGITEYELRNDIAEISDDTQMTLFTATGLLVGTTRGMNRGIMGPYEGYISYSYRDWYRTQKENYPLSGNIKYSWLVNITEMFSRRAPGNTCLSALSQTKEGTMENPINNSKGCGGVMRAAPIGLYFANGNYDKMKQTEIDLIGAKVAAITHGHELGYIPAAALVHIINLLAKNDKISVLDAVADSVVSIIKVFKESEYLRQFHKLMEKAADLAVSSDNDIDAIRQLGEGWVAEETLAIAVYCAIKYSDNFEKAIIAAVNHDGDSDSTGAVAGNILGAALGIDAIPQKFLDRLELKDVILEIAEDLYNDCPMSEYGPRDELWASKYIEISYGGKS
ncbi:MAG: ADP-ribosylglycohydrolase family protein [Oscillospiraceae bacterium]|nr:ADP-ribosylglycohydrolase family protein [Oscillospiraceae bacterium]